MSETENLTIAEAFIERPKRFALLCKGVENAGWNSGKKKLIEIGCSRGDATSFMSDKYGHSITGVDLSPELIDAAKEKHGAKGLNLSFVSGDATALPFENEGFDGLYSEAAFSLLNEKEKAVKEYFRVLKPGSNVVINDFIMRGEINPDDRKDVLHIPCFSTVQTLQLYKKIFEDNGFKTVFCKDEFNELLNIAKWLCKVYKTSISDIGKYLSCYFSNQENDNCPANDSGKVFFKKAKISYCQILFQKK